MKSIIVDDNLKGKLSRLLQPVELCDSTGKVLGQFTPQPDPEYLLSLIPEISEEELQRREQEPGGRTLAEIMADLRKHP